MCNEKDFEPFEEDEREESKNYRKKRGALEDAVKQIENAKQEALEIIVEALVENPVSSTKMPNTKEIVKALKDFKITFSENDEFRIKTERGMYKYRVSTSFRKKDKKIKETINEIKALNGFFKSKTAKMEIQECKVVVRKILKTAFEKLEEAFTEYAKI